MDTNYSVDSLLREALHSSEKPDDELMNRIRYRYANGHGAIRRAGMKRPLRLVAAIVAGLLAVSATAVAVGAYLGGFDKLREVIGWEQADKLNAVEKSNVVGELLTEEGIRIEVVAVGVDSNAIDFYFTLEDMVSDRLDGDIWINATVFPTEENIHWGKHVMSPEVIDRSDDGVVTLHGREVFEYPITGRELQFNIYDISYNIKSGECDMEFDFDSLENRLPAAWYYDTPILPPNLHGIEPEVEGVEDRWYSHISSIGIIDGKLHIQNWLDGALWNPPDAISFHPVDPDGRCVMFDIEPQWKFATPRFSLDEQGGINLIYDPDQYPEGDFILYCEYIYEVDLARLSEYRLVAEYTKGDQIDLRIWSTVFEISGPNGN